MREMDLGPGGPRDAGAECNSCSRRGTVARVARLGVAPGAPPIILRYCDNCWPAAKDAHRAEDATALREWQARFHVDPAGTPAPPDSWLMESGSWHDAVETIAVVVADLGAGAVGADVVAALAAGYARVASERDEPAPQVVRAFLARFGPPAV